MDQATKQEILRLDEQGLMGAQIARQIGVSQPTVSVFLRSVGRGKGRGGSQRLFDRQQILALWTAEQNQTKVAKLLGTSQAVISGALRSIGIRVGRGKRSPLHKLPMERIAQQYRDGLNTVQIAAEFQLDPEVIRRRLIRHGVKMRTRGVHGADNFQYKHGRGYEPMHYFRRQSYEVAAICLQQPLPRGWVIHHLDENPENNQPENMILFPSQRNHARFHQMQLAIQRSGKTTDAIQLALENGGVKLPLPRVPIVFAHDIVPRVLSTNP